MKPFEPTSRLESMRHANTHLGFGFTALREQFTEEEIALCLDYLTRKGVPGTGEICHSAMAFLATAITAVRPLAEVERSKYDKKQRRIEAERLEVLRRERDVR